MPEPALSVVRRWPRSLPQYAVGHLDRIAELEKLAGALPGLRLVGNAYHGVGLADLIREGRAAARSRCCHRAFFLHSIRENAPVSGARATTNGREAAPA